MQGQKQTILGLRQQIDIIDLELLQLLNSRACIVMRIQEIKQQMRMPPYSAAREGEIIARLRNANKGPLSSDAVEDIFNHILKHSLLLREFTKE